MTQSGFTSIVVNALLGWLKGLARWVLRLFDLVGGASPLMFLANNWKKLLVLLLVIGVAVDLVVWLVRWRPHWVWLRKKRVIVNDKNFFADEAEFDEGESRRGQNGRRRAKGRGMWEDEEYVVPSTMVPRRGERRQKPVRPRPTEPRRRDVFRDDSFNVNSRHRFADRYEDEVFDINSLPEARSEEKREARSKERTGARSEDSSEGRRSASPRPGDGSRKRAAREQA